MRSSLSLSLGLLGGCSFLAKGIEDTVPPVDIEVDMIDKGVTPGNTLQDLSVAVTVDGSTPFEMNADGTGNWGAALVFDALIREGGDDGFLALTIDDLSVTGPGPVQLSVELLAMGQGAVLGGDIDAAAPVQPAACLISVDPAAVDAVAHAADVLACMRAWTDTNGAPSSLGLQITATSRLAGFVYTGTYVLSTDQPLEVGCEREIVLPDDVLESAEDIDVSVLAIGGYGGAFQHGLVMLGIAGVYDPDNIARTAASLSQRIESGQAYYIGQIIDVEAGEADDLIFQTNLASLNYAPTDPGDWTLATYEALVGDGPGASGHAEVCWGELHDEVPNTGLVRWILLGLGELVY